MIVQLLSALQADSTNIILWQYLEAIKMQAHMTEVAE